MSTPEPEPTHTMQEQVLTALKQSQDAVVRAVETWSDAVARVPRPNVEVPAFAKDLPKPEEILESTFDFAQKVLDAQRDFARNVLRAATQRHSDEAQPGDRESPYQP
jgi:hypothetical protein